MNCIFDSFNKKEATANPFLQPNKNDPGKFTFPTCSALAQAAQLSSGQAAQSGPSFSFRTRTSGFAGFTPSSTTTFSGFGHTTRQTGAPFAQTPQQSLFPAQQPQSLFPSSQPFLGVRDGVAQIYGSYVGSNSHMFNTINTAPQQTSVRLTKHTPKITIEKVLALMSSEWYVKDEDITVVSQLAPACDPKDVTKVAPIAVAAFVDESALAPLVQLPKTHVKFLQELVQETVKTEEDVWKCVTNLATSHGLYNVVQYINAVRPHKTLTMQPQQINPEIAFVLAVHAFVTNNNRPHDVMTMCKGYKDAATMKLAADMCMASYGLSWILETQTPDYISKHRNTYTLSC